MKGISNFVVLVLLLQINLSAQAVVFRYNFDDCTFEDASILFPGLTPGGNPLCVCGLGDSSYSLDGNNDFLTVSTQANKFMDEDFTLDFYFWMDDQSGETDIFSHRNGCASLDSLMALRYFSSTNELLFEIGSNVNNYHSVRAVLSKERCWHRFTLVKFNLEYLVYFDNVLIKRIISRENIGFSRGASLTFANSPCNSINQAIKMKGRIDDITLYKRALSDFEISSIYQFPDRIKTDNTTIFKGESITIESGTSCASLVTWTPSSTLDDPNAASPLASPEESTTYRVNFNNGTCTSTDTVRIFVADKNRLDCNNLLLPKAFTPNNDGLNDRFGISNIFLVEALEYFEIYDRWGAKVWDTVEVNDQWDGTLKGQPLNSGMYLYKIKYTCNQQEKLNINNFSLIR